MTTPPAAAAELDPRTALVVVDLQEFVHGLPYTHDVVAVARRAGELAAAFRGAGLPVVLTRVAGGVSGRTDRRMQLPGTITAADLALMPELGAAEGDLDLPKRHWGAFTSTPLAEHLTRAGVTQLVIAGVATGFGVESTARHGSELGYEITVAADAVTDMDAAVHERAIEKVYPALGQVRDTAAIVAALSHDGGTSPARMA